MTHVAWEFEGELQMSLPDREWGAAGVLSQVMPRCSFSWAEMCVQASASKTVPETSFQGKIKPILLAFQQELFFSRVYCAFGVLRPGGQEK